MTPKKIQNLIRTLDEAHTRFMETNEAFADALGPALKFQDHRDKEFVAFICSVLAYGRIAQVKKSIHAVIDPMGDKPVEWLLRADDKLLTKTYRGWKHRFNTSHDILLFLNLLKQVYAKYQTLESFFEPSKHTDTFAMLVSFRKRFYALIPKNKKPKDSFHFLIPDPELNSASKRMNLFLKWMVRDTEPDFGLWKSYSKDKLIVPLDTHIYKQARSLGMTKRTAADLQTAIEITDFLKKLDPKDPTRFDFALCHLGIHGQILK